MAESQTELDTIETIVRWATTREIIRAVILTSTRAIPGGAVDALSDFDVVLVVTDIQPFITDHGWLEDFGEVMLAYWDPLHPDPLFGIDLCANVIQYKSGLKIDFTLWPVELLKQIISAPSLPAELDAGYQVLLDKDHRMDTLQPPSGKAYTPARPTQEAYQLLINDFLSEAPYVAKCLWRDELLPAKWCLDFDMKYTYLMHILEWRIEIEHDWSIPVGYLGKGLKKRLPDKLWADLEQTFSGPQIEDNWKALTAIMRLFRTVAIEVGNNLGYAYPEELHDQVIKYIESIRLLEHKGVHK